MAKEEPICLLIAEDEQMLRTGLAGLGWAAQGITLLPTAACSSAPHPSTIPRGWPSIMTI